MSNTYLTRNIAAGDKRTNTFSFWLKRSANLSNTQYFFNAFGPGGFNDGSGNTDWMGFFVDNNNRFGFTTWSGGIQLKTSRMFRDVAAWYHLVFRFDTTQASDTNKLQMYVNGEQQTIFQDDDYPSQNHDFNCFGSNTATFQIGNSVSGTHGSPSQNSQYFNGYIAQAIYTQGQSYAPTVFGSTNSNGVWVPNSSPSVTYGTNGFKLDFANSGTNADANGFGADSSGQGNHFASNNLQTNPNTKDTPHNNFCTMSHIDKGSNAGTLTLGGLKMTNGTSGSADNQKFRGTMAVTKGKWYFEMKKLANTASIGLLATEEKINQTSASGMLVEYLHQGEMRYWNGSARVTKTTGIDAYTTNDIVGCALDMDNRRAYFSKNGFWQGDPTPNPASSPSGAGQMAAIQTGFTMSPCFMDDTTASAGEAAMNFGNPPFTISSNSGNGNADANGYGKFEYAVPSGYYALCTKNLAQYG